MKHNQACIMINMHFSLSFEYWQLWSIDHFSTIF